MSVLPEQVWDRRQTNIEMGSEIGAPARWSSPGAGLPFIQNHEHTALTDRG